jgi:4-hydroxy-tetrahydrodipicolinate synthase
MMVPLVRGVYAALLTPRRTDGSIDEASFARLLEFLLERGIAGFALNGATGEFCLTTPQHLRTLFSVIRRVAGDVKILCGIGAAGAASSIELMRIAAGEGAQAALLPMPYFFPYGQQDLEAFARTVAASAELPILLYNLPEFTSPLEAETACRIIRDTPNVIGIKDSGQSIETLRQLTRQKIPSCRMVGNDGLLLDALREDVCDGVVSGIACVLPELIRAIFDERTHTRMHLSGLLDEVRQQLAQFPVPWALKWIAEARGICKATFSQPLAETRKAQGAEFVDWYRQWETNLSTISAMSKS